jgi:acetyl-CoA acetyltransferase family protein
MRNAVIVDVVRSPMGKGKPGGALSSVHPVDLMGQVLAALVQRNRFDPAMIDDVLIGCATQSGEQASIARMAALSAGFPVQVPAVTIDRKCGSSQQAVHFAAQGVVAGAYDIAIAGGVESMSRVPIGSNRMSMDDLGPTVRERFAGGLIGTGVAAERVAAKWSISREDMDGYAARSHALAAAAADQGRFDREIVPIRVDGGDVVDADESIRRGTTVDGLAQLKPVFESDAIKARFPEISWSITAGNASQITDGAAAILVMEEQTALRLGLTPRARFVAFDVIGDDPLMMLTAPIPATRRVLKKAGLTVGDIDQFEVNEAFASVPLAWARELKADPDLLNPRGGAIALGHPLGCSGARLMGSLLAGLHETGGKLGLQAICENGGMANATIIERL